MSLACPKCRTAKVVSQLGGISIKCEECNGVGYINQPTIQDVLTEQAKNAEDVKMLEEILSEKKRQRNRPGRKPKKIL